MDFFRRNKPTNYVEIEAQLPKNELILEFDIEKFAEFSFLEESEAITWKRLLIGCIEPILLGLYFILVVGLIIGVLSSGGFETSDLDWGALGAAARVNSEGVAIILGIFLAPFFLAAFILYVPIAYLGTRLRDRLVKEQVAGQIQVVGTIIEHTPIKVRREFDEIEALYNRHVSLAVRYSYQGKEYTQSLMGERLTASPEPEDKLEQHFYVEYPIGGKITVYVDRKLPAQATLVKHVNKQDCEC